MHGRVQSSAARLAVMHTPYENCLPPQGAPFEPQCCAPFAATCLIPIGLRVCQVASSCTLACCCAKVDCTHCCCFVTPGWQVFCDRSAWNTKWPAAFSASRQRPTLCQPCRRLRSWCRAPETPCSCLHGRTQLSTSCTAFGTALPSSYAQHQTPESQPTGGPGGSRFRPRQRDSLPDDVAALTELKQHTKPVTCMCLDVANQQLYTGAQDGLVCAWSCASGQVGGGVAALEVLLVRLECAFWGIAGGPRVNSY